MPRVAAIIIQDGSLALIERNRGENKYYVFPGGQVEPGETHTEALVREIKEELGLEIDPGLMVAEVVFQGNNQFHFLANVTGGEFGTGKGADVMNLQPADRGTYKPIMMPLNKVLGADIRPRAVAELAILAQLHGWPEVATHFQEGN